MAKACTYYAISVIGTDAFQLKVSVPITLIA